MTESTARRLLLLGALTVAIFSFQPWDGLFPDQTGYAIWLTSLVFDADLDLTNDVLASCETPESILGMLAEFTDRGLMPNRWSMGPAWIWGAPFALWGLIEQAVTVSVDRFAWHLRAVISLLTLALGFHALLLLHRTLREFFSPGVSAAAAGLALIGSPLVIHWVAWPAMAHIPAFWATVLLWHLSVRLWRRGPGAVGWLDWSVGLAVGLVVLCRWSGIVWAAVPGMVYLSQLRGRENRRVAVKGMLLAAGGAFLVFLPQMIAWRAIHGTWFVIPQGEGFLFGDRSLALVPVLLSPWNGLIFTHPWLVIAVIGLMLWDRRPTALLVGGVVGVIGLWIITAGVEDWWATQTFGARRWGNAFPLFALGWAAALDRLPPGAVRRWLGGGATLLFIAVNLVLASLWARGAVTEDQWFQVWHLRGEVLRSLVAAPLSWPTSTGWGMLLHQPWQGMIGLLLLLLPAVVGVAVAWFAGWGERPLPRPRWLAGIATAWAVVMVAWTAVAALRTSPSEEHLLIRSVVRDGAPFHFTTPPGEARWALLACRDPKHVPALMETQSRLGWMLLCAEGVSSELIREALPRLREGDPHLTEALMQRALEASDLETLDLMLRTRPLAHPETALRMRLAVAALAGEPVLPLVRSLHALQPHDPAITLELARIAGARGNGRLADRAGRSGQRWCEARLSSWERLLPYRPDGLQPWERDILMHWMLHHVRLAPGDQQSIDRRYSLLLEE